ncbi:MAG TPA: PD-(D/E)XK nuclease family protein [Solirubrobacteraceae bacterium]
MPLTLVLGPANSAKAGEVLGAYGEAAHRGALLVVPTAADAAYYGREVAGRGAVLGSVLTFAGLAGEIAGRAGYGERRLSAFQRRRVMSRLLGDTRFQVMGESAESAGFANAAIGLITELERALVRPPRFAQALQRWAAGDPRREGYAADLGVLYRSYVDELARLGAADRDLHAWRALDALRADPGRWGADAVFFYGFDELTALERDAVETLSRVVGAQVTVSLPYEPGRHAFAARAEAVEELRPLAGRVLELPALDDYYAPAARAALHHLERSLFEESPERLDPGVAVALLEAGGERAEAELIAAEILGLLGGGVAAEEIVVVARSPGRAGPVLERVFDQYGLAVAIDRQVRFAHTALGHGVLALARCAWSPNASAADLLAYLRTPGRLERPEVADRLEFDARREGLQGLAETRERLGWALEEIEALADAADPGEALAREARKLFASPHRRTARVLEPEEELDARALAALLRAVAELSDLGELPTGTDLIEVLDELVVDAGRPVRPGAVLIADPLAIRARRFRAVFVCGLQEGQFPLPGVPEPFLSDERRRELAAASGLVLRPAENSVQRERYLFYACVSRATDRVILSYRSSDEEGNIELPSPFLADVSELLAEGWSERRRRRLLADVVWEPVEAPTDRELARSRAAAAAPLRGDVASPMHALGEVALSHVRHSEVVSAGALENYAGCPVRWLVERELSPARFEPEPEPLARGNYMHALLEALVRRLGEPVTAESLPRALSLLDELVSELPVTVAVGRSAAVRQAAIRSIESDLRRYLAHEARDEAAWRPERIEQRFGFLDDPVESDRADSLPPLVLGADGEQVVLRGLIDRIDVDPAGSGRAIVRDYKSGSARAEHQGARWESERQLQVALYMLAVRELLGLDPVAGLYQPLGGNDLRGRGVFLKDAPVGRCVVGTDARSPEELDEVLTSAADRAVELAGRLRAGDIEPCPRTCSRDGCRYPGICRSP